MDSEWFAVFFMERDRKVRVVVVWGKSDPKASGAFFVGTAEEFSLCAGTQGGIPQGSAPATRTCFQACVGKPTGFAFECSFDTSEASASAQRAPKYGVSAVRGNQHSPHHHRPYPQGNGSL